MRAPLKAMHFEVCPNGKVFLQWERMRAPFIPMQALRALRDKVFFSGSLWEPIDFNSFWQSKIWQSPSRLPDMYMGLDWGKNFAHGDVQRMAPFFSTQLRQKSDFGKKQFEGSVSKPIEKPHRGLSLWHERSR